MKILIGNNHLKDLGGSEVFAFTLITNFKALGHDVYFTTHITGEVSAKCEEYATYIDPKDIINHKFDCAFIAHNTVVDLPIRAKKVVQICHGIVPGLEDPHPVADHYIAVSQEVRDRLKSLGHESTVLHNPIDFDRCKSSRPINQKPECILSICQGEAANETVKQACKELGIEFLSFSKTRESVWHIEDQINKADLVVTIARGVWESMACERNVIIYDSRSYDKVQGDGFMCEEIFDKSLYHNGSGRGYKKAFDVESLKTEIQKYSVEQGQWNHNKVKSIFDAKMLVQQYIDLPVKKTWGNRIHILKKQVKSILGKN